VAVGGCRVLDAAAGVGPAARLAGRGLRRARDAQRRSCRRGTLPGLPRLGRAAAEPQVALRAEAGRGTSKQATPAFGCSRASATGWSSRRTRACSARPRATSRCSACPTGGRCSPRTAATRPRAPSGDSSGTSSAVSVRTGRPRRGLARDPPCHRPTARSELPQDRFEDPVAEEDEPRESPVHPRGSPHQLTSRTGLTSRRAGTSGKSERRERVGDVRRRRHTG